MASAIVPVAQPLMLCEEIDVEGGMVNVYGLFNALRPQSFPYTRELLCVFAQLRGGLGELSVRFEILRARDEFSIRTSEIHRLRFERRTQLLRLWVQIEHVVFEEPGVYLVQLFCDDTWVADVSLEVLESR
jgi:hypothetical protein